jgi:hypothetical protein
MPVEDATNSLEDLCFNTVNVRQMTATGTTPNKQLQMKPLSLFLLTLIRNKQTISQVIFKLNSLDRIIIKIE